MATALPYGYPAPPAPAFPAPVPDDGNAAVAWQAAAPAPSSDNDDAQWLGIYALAGGIALVGLGAVALAVINAKEHDQMRAEIEGVDQRLVDYRQAHALVHANLQAEIARLTAAAATAAASVARPLLPTTMYGEPALPFSLVSVAAPPIAPMPTVPISTRPVVVSAGGLQEALGPAPMSLAPVALRLPSLPPHVEAAVASASRPRSTPRHTLLGA